MDHRVVEILRARPAMTCGRREYGRDLIEAELTDIPLAAPVHHETERTDRASAGLGCQPARNIHPRLHQDLAPEEPVQTLLDLGGRDPKDLAPTLAASVPVPLLLYCADEGSWLLGQWSEGAWRLQGHREHVLNPTHWLPVSTDVVVESAHQQKGVGG